MELSQMTLITQLESELSYIKQLNNKHFSAERVSLLRAGAIYL